MIKNDIQNSFSDVIQLCNGCGEPLEKFRVVYSKKTRCRECQRLSNLEYGRNKARLKGGTKEWKAMK